MTAGPALAAPSLAARVSDALSFEWTKLRSVRSNYLTLLISALVTTGATAVVAFSFATAPLPKGTLISPLTASYIAFAEYGVLPVCVLGVLVFTSEYTTGMIRVTYTAVPQRPVVLAAKAVVSGAVALVAGEALSFILFLLTQAIMSSHHRGLSLSRPGVPGAVLAAGALLAICALVGLALGAIIRHAIGAVLATVGMVYLLALACLLLPSPWNDRIGRFTIAMAATQVVSLHPQSGLLSPALSLCVLIAWPVAALLAAAIVITRHDA